jgi:hypothetical protein
VEHSVRKLPPLEFVVRLTHLSDHPKPANEGHLKTGQR